MSAPTKTVERFILSAEINHLNNPVLAWNFDNAVVVSDAADNIKIAKDKSTEKVDGAVAEVMAVAEWLDYISEEREEDAYSEGGVRTL